MSVAQPYAAAAKYYVQAGWLGALPLPARSKHPVPPGFTGHDGLDPSMRDIEKWLVERADGNVALRMPHDVIGIDVDAYGDKPGATTLAQLEERFGPLPPTWRTTSRLPQDSVSGIRFYRVPEGTRWPSVAGPGIEMVHRGHRYAVAPPSVHPETQRPYQWVNELTGEAGFSFPRPSGLPMLPPAWVEGLSAMARSAGPAARCEPPEDAQGWLSPGMPCRAVLGQLERHSEALSQQGSRHDSTRDLQVAVLHLGQQGHVGVGQAIETMRQAFVAAVGPDRQGGAAEADLEWSSMMTGAFEIVAADPRQAETCGGGECGREKAKTPPELVGLVVNPESARQAATADLLTALREEEDRFFEQSEVLRHVRDFARARMASPWATLGVVLVRSVCAVPSQVVVPAIVGKEVAPNLYLGIVGTSGSGKQAAEGAAEDAFVWPTLKEYNLGSGEGVVDKYMKWVGKNEERRLERTEHDAILWRASEVDAIKALQGRSGSTLLPVIRDGWNGDALGFGGYKADNGKEVPRLSYRMGIVIGIQPERADALFSEEERAGGTPQRFLWAPAQDPLVPDIEPDEPARWHLHLPRFEEYGAIQINGRRRFEVPDRIQTIIREAARDRHRGKVDALDGHALLARLKVAFALAVLHGRAGVDEEAWAMAGQVMAKSDATRLMVQDALQGVSKQASVRQGRAEGFRTLAKEEVLKQPAVERVRRLLLRKVGEDWVSESQIKKKFVAPRDRDFYEDAIGGLVREGIFEMDDTPYRNKPRTRYRRRP